MIPENLERGNFGSRLGFILAGAGSAIGLGNIWRFPYTVGEQGGGAFILVYLIFVVAVGVPVMFAELSIGRASQKNPVGAFKALAPRSMWSLVGYLGVVIGFSILAFYSVIAGWTLGFLWDAVTGKLASLHTAAQVAQEYTDVSASPWEACFLTAVFLLLTMLVVKGGVSGGIERASKILMPIFLVILIILAIRAVTLPGAKAGVHFLVHFSWSKITPAVVMNALGQALFSLSLGMGAMITYGSYLQRREPIPFSGASVAFFDTLIAILAGFIIFPTIFATGGDPQGGPQLVFITMPVVFNAIPGGYFIGVAFYALLAIAALTSTISLLEVVVSYFIDERGWARSRATWIVGSACFLLAIPSALSQGAVAVLGGGEGSWLGIDFLSLQNILFGNYGLAIGAVLICLFVGWYWTVPSALEEIERTGKLPGRMIWSLVIRFICPLAVLAILVFIATTGQYF